MTYYRFPEGKCTKTLMGMILTGLLFFSRDSIYAMNVIGFTTSQVITAGLLLTVGLVFLAVNRGRLGQIFTDPRILAAGIFTVVMLLPMAAKQDWQLMYFSVLLGLYVAVLFSYFSTVEEVSRSFVLVITVLSAYSLLTHYGLRHLAERGLVQVPTFVNPMGHIFYGFGLSAESVAFVASRNFGLFREPGVYQYFLILALFLNNYRVLWEKRGHLWVINGVLAVTMLSTFATGGVIEMGLLAAVMFFDKKWYKSRLGIGLCVGVIAAVAAIAAFIVIRKGPVYDEMYYMFYKLVSPEESTVSRLGSIFMNLEMFLQNPLVGQPFSTVLHALPANTSSTMILFAAMGILAGGLHVISWFALVWDKNRHPVVNLALAMVLFMGFNTQNLTWDIYLWLLPGMALLEKGILRITKRIAK